MRTCTITAARTAILTAAFAGLLAGCGHSSTAASAPGQQLRTQPASQMSGSGAMSADCQAYTKLLQSSSAALASNDASQMETVADQDAAAAATLSNPKLKEAVVKLSQYYKEQAAYKRNPRSSTMPDSGLMNSANDNFAEACVPHK